MGLLSRWFDKWFAPEPNTRRITANAVHAALNNNIMGGKPADIVKMDTMTADLWRTGMAERLGREVSDTPMPGEINGTQVIVDDTAEANTLTFEWEWPEGLTPYHPEKFTTRKIDIGKPVI